MTNNPSIYTFDDQEKWINAVQDAVQNKKCKAMLLSGASAAGKTFMSEEFKKVLEQQGKKVFIFSTDNFYKGITRNILDKAEKNFYNGHIENKQKIIEIVRAHSIELQFQEKYADKSVEELKKKLDGVAEPELVDHLRTEFERINFDEPEAVDLNTAIEFLNTLVLEPKKYVCLPEYSFLTGEYRLLEKNNIKGEDYDFFIMEGIFSLNEKVVNGLKIDVVKSFVECTLNTLLIRKLNRDITKGRSSMTKENVILSYLNIIIPAYFTYILPTKQNADFVYINSYSSDEANNILTSNQQKYRIDEKDIEKLKNYDILKQCKQVDYFFTFKGDTNLISLREENNELIEFNYKSNGSGLVRRTSESIRLKGELSTKYRDAREFSKLFIKAGFDFDVSIRKRRTLYNVGDIFFRFDEVVGLGTNENTRNVGYFIEFMGENETQINYIRKQLNLTDNKKVGSYYTLMQGVAMQERTIKLKLNNIPEFILQNKDLYKPKMINLYYLNVSNDYCNYTIKNTIALNIINKSRKNTSILKAIREAKIMVDEISKNKYVYTLIVKYGRNFLNEKIEKEIPVEIAKDLISAYTDASIEKLSYKIEDTKDYKIDVDHFNNIIVENDNKPLISCVIHYNNMNREDALNKLINKLQLKEGQYKDITYDLEFSNKNIKKIKK